MIEIRQHTPAQLKLYNNKEFIGFVNNNIEALQVRLDIGKQKLEGYYFMFGDRKIDILPNAGVKNWPEELYRETTNLCVKIYNLNK